VVKAFIPARSGRRVGAEAPPNGVLAPPPRLCELIRLLESYTILVDSRLVGSAEVELSGSFLNFCFSEPKRELLLSIVLDLRIRVEVRLEWNEGALSISEKMDIVAK
jgi:hypothetical protein